ncbi:MAG: hypothetical protein ACOH2M_04635 [Cypionkella sp.]|jgi:hypothetical protein
MALPCTGDAMPLLFSAPDGFSMLGWLGYLKAALIAWLAPALLAAVALALQWGLGTQNWGNGWLMLWTFSVLMLFSPALSWAALVLAAPLVAVLMNRGWFGYIPALVIGMGLGAALGYVIGNEAIVTFAAALLALLRAAAARIRPAAFR